MSYRCSFLVAKFPPVHHSVFFRHACALLRFVLQLALSLRSRHHLRGFPRPTVGLEEPGADREPRREVPGKLSGKAAGAKVVAGARTDGDLVRIFWFLFSCGDDSAVGHDDLIINAHGRYSCRWHSFVVTAVVWKKVQT